MLQEAVHPQRSQLRVAADFALVSLIWGSTWLVIKGQLGVVPPAWSVVYRFAIAAVALFVYGLVTRQWRTPTRAMHGFAAVAGFAQFAVNFNFVYASEQYLTSGLVSLVFALLIVSNTVGARVFLKAPIGVRFVVGSSIGFAGLALVFAHDLVVPTARAQIALGVVLAVAGVLGASVSNVMQAGRLGRSLPPLPTLVLMMAYGSVFNVGFALAVAGRPVVDPRPEYALGLAYLAIVASVVAFSVYYRLIRDIGPGPAAYTSVVIPIVAMALSTAFEGYRWTPMTAVGAALAITGLVVALRGRRT